MKDITETPYCPCCKEHHAAYTQKFIETETVDGVKIPYETEYRYCPRKGGYYITEDLTNQDQSAKEAAIKKAI